MRHDAGGEGDTGEGADNHRIPEWAGGSHQGVLHSIRGLRRGRHDGGGTQTSLVREQAAAHTLLQGQHDGGADEAARGSLGIKGAVHNVADSRPHKAGIGAENSHATHHIHHSHGGHQGGAHAGNTLQTTQQHRADKHHHHRTGHPGGNLQRTGSQHLRNGVGLGQVADTEGGNSRHHGKGHGQPLALEALFNGIHGAADDVALLITRAVADSQQAFGIARGHAQHTRHHAPEHRTRAARGHGHGHTHDIAGAHIGRQRYHERGELGNLPLALAAEIQAQAGEQVALRETQQEGQVKVGAQQCKYEDIPPQETAGAIEHLINGF